MRLKKMILSVLGCLFLVACTIKNDNEPTPPKMEITLKDQFEQSYVFHYLVKQASYIDVGVYVVQEDGKKEVSHTRQRLQQKEGEVLFTLQENILKITLPTKEEEVILEKNVNAYKVTSEKQKEVKLDEENVVLAISEEKVKLSSFINPTLVGTYYIVVSVW